MRHHDDYPPEAGMTVGYEDDVEDYLVAQIEALDGICPKLVDVGRKGFPDRTPMIPGHQIHFVETKCKTGKVKTWQARYHATLRELGFSVFVLRTKAEVDEYLRDILA